MRIVNTGYSPRYLSYGDAITGGKTLEPGKESRELPLSYVHSALLWKDLDKGAIQIRLNDEDKAFLRKTLEAGDKPIVMQQPPAPPAPPPAPVPPPPKPVLQPVLNDPVPEIPQTPGDLAVKDMMKNLNYEDLKAGPTQTKKSLQDLMKANQSVGMPKFADQGKKATMSEIATHMGNRV